VRCFLGELPAAIAGPIFEPTSTTTQIEILPICKKKHYEPLSELVSYDLVNEVVAKTWNAPTKDTTVINIWQEKYFDN
jgi:hypothetical protein